MKKILVLIFGLQLLFLACNRNVKDYPRDLRIIEEEGTPIIGTVLISDSILTSTRIVAYFDNTIITRSYSGENILDVYTNSNSKYTKKGSLAKKGAGPYEFSGSLNCYVDTYKKRMYLFGIVGGSKIDGYEIDITDPENLYKTSTWKKILMPTEDNSFFKSILHYSDSCFIGVGGNFSSNNLLSSLCLNEGGYQEMAITYPDDKIAVDNSIKRIVYNEGEIIKRPKSSTLLYYCTNWGNYAEIIDLSGRELKDRRIVASSYPLYATSPDGMNSVSDNETLMGMKASVTEKYIYLLPNFRTKKEYVEKKSVSDFPPDHSNKIIVFDWDGRYIANYNLDKSISTFFVSPDDGYLIGTSASSKNEDIEFVRFELKSKQ